MRKILFSLLLLVCITNCTVLSYALTPLETSIWNELLAVLPEPWEVVTITTVQGVRLHIGVKDILNDQFSKDWKGASPHTDIAKLCANIAFACAEKSGGGYWVSVSIQDKTDRAWESYRWRESMYKDGSVTTNGWINEF